MLGALAKQTCLLRNTVVYSMHCYTGRFIGLLGRIAFLPQVNCSRVYFQSKLGGLSPIVLVQIQAWLPCSYISKWTRTKGENAPDFESCVLSQHLHKLGCVSCKLGAYQGKLVRFQVLNDNLNKGLVGRIWFTQLKLIHHLGSNPFSFFYIIWQVHESDPDLLIHISLHFCACFYWSCVNKGHCALAKSTRGWKYYCAALFKHYTYIRTEVIRESLYIL